MIQFQFAQYTVIKLLIPAVEMMTNNFISISKRRE